ncbi:MAG: hypothetical protein IPK13_25830 [Deltaproteobacteria bacterium]|nr:hypothetical protein [Deltaproteobacteria bacterium]
MSYGKTRSAGLFALWILGAACATTRGEEAIVSSLSASDYAPLRVGASWTYAMMFLGQRGEMTIRMLGERDGYFYDNKGGMFRHTPEGLRDPKRYLIRTPIQPGNRWKSIVSASAVEHYEIVRVGEPCESEAGAFSDCLVIVSSLRKDANVSLRIRWTWARHVGLLKVETEALIKGQGVQPQTKQSLIRYALNGAREKGAGDPGGGADRTDTPTAPDVGAVDGRDGGDSAPGGGGIEGDGTTGEDGRMDAEDSNEPGGWTR